MADKVSNVQKRAQKVRRINYRTILFKIVWWLLPAHIRSELWGNFQQSYKSPWHLIRETVDAIRGVIRRQTKDPYYPGMALVQTLAISASRMICRNGIWCFEISAPRGEE